MSDNTQSFQHVYCRMFLLDNLLSTCFIGFFKSNQHLLKVLKKTVSN